MKQRFESVSEFIFMTIKSLSFEISKLHVNSTGGLVTQSLLLPIKKLSNS